MASAVENWSEIEISDAEVEEIIAEAGGDPRHAIRSLRYDLTKLALDAEASVSKGFVRGHLLPFRVRGGL